MTINEILQNVKKDSAALAVSSNRKRNEALKQIINALNANKEKIFAANKKDMENAISDGMATPIVSRLKFNEDKLNVCISGINDLIALDDPLRKVILKRELDKDLVLTQLTCPIGVIGVIFESRPDALVQISALCIKSGNCSVLKGGSEAKNTNRALYEVIYNAGIDAGLPAGFLTLIEDRAGIAELLKCHKEVDLIIPRGSNAFVQYIMENSKIPVMGHADGICHIYVDKDADVDLAIKVIEDSKTQYPAACNALETLLVHEDIYDKIISLLPDTIQVREGDYSEEYLDCILTAKPIASLEDAVIYINQHGSHHTDCIITEDKTKAEYFMNYVDSAGVYHNCSTRFADGYRYGFGAEVGISTGKLHARGPVGLDGLVTYKYTLQGHGQIVGDYASGKSKFNFNDLKK